MFVLPEPPSLLPAPGPRSAFSPVRVPGSRYLRPGPGMLARAGGAESQWQSRAAAPGSRPAFGYGGMVVEPAMAGRIEAGSWQQLGGLAASLNRVIFGGVD